jgi:hypothetical protein
MTTQAVVQGEEPEDSTEQIYEIGEGASSLGLLSTLVMAVAMDGLLKEQQETSFLMLAVANAFSVYTVTYSILEYYYVKAIIGTKSKISRKRTDRRWNSSLGQDEAANKPKYTPAHFVNTASEKFDQFYMMRAACRNSMWMSMIYIFSAMLTTRRSTAFGDTGKGLGTYFANLDSTEAALAILLWTDFLLLCALIFLGDYFFKILISGAVVFTILCAADLFVLKIDLSMAVLTDFMILINIVVVAGTVKSFRRLFVDFLNEAAS